MTTIKVTTTEKNNGCAYLPRSLFTDLLKQNIGTLAVGSWMLINGKYLCRVFPCYSDEISVSSALELMDSHRRVFESFEIIKAKREITLAKISICFERRLEEISFELLEAFVTASLKNKILTKALCINLGKGGSHIYIHDIMGCENDGFGLFTKNSLFEIIKPFIMKEGTERDEWNQFSDILNSFIVPLQSKSDLFKSNEESNTISFYKNTILISGPSGIGKTTLIKRIAQNYINCEIHEFNPRKVINQSPQKYIKSFFNRLPLCANVGCVKLIENIDSLVSINDDQCKTIINALIDEIIAFKKRPNGYLLVVTTSAVSNMDKSFMNGFLFDRIFILSVPNHSERLAILKNIILSEASNHSQTEIIDQCLLEEVAAITHGFVASELLSLCISANQIAQNNPSSCQLQKSTEKPLQIPSFECFKAALAGITPALHREYKISLPSKELSWESIGGYAEAKKALKQALSWPFLYKQTFKRLGLKVPKGILLYGPPGCCKTSLARIVASQSNAAFLSLDGASLYSCYLGESETILRNTFAAARRCAPAVIFLDEIDALVGKRNINNNSSSGDEGGDSVSQRILLTLLTEMDGISSIENVDKDVLVLGATNRIHAIDDALKRPGRFDRIIEIPFPDAEAKKQIISLYLSEIERQLIDIDLVSEKIGQVSGADIKNIIQNARFTFLRNQNRTEHVLNVDDIFNSISELSF